MRGWVVVTQPVSGGRPLVGRESKKWLSGPGDAEMTRSHNKHPGPGGCVREQRLRCDTEMSLSPRNMAINNEHSL